MKHIKRYISSILVALMLINSISISNATELEKVSSEIQLENIEIEENKEENIIEENTLTEENDLFFEENKEIVSIELNEESNSSLNNEVLTSEQTNEFSTEKSILEAGITNENNETEETILQENNFESTEDIIDLELIKEENDISVLSNEASFYESTSRVTQSAFENAIELNEGATCKGIVELNGKDETDSEIPNVLPVGGLNGVDVMGYNEVINNKSGDKAFYTVEWYDTEGECIKQETREGLINEIIKIKEEDKICEGYVFHEKNPSNVLQETLTESGTRLILYFEKVETSYFTLRKVFEGLTEIPENFSIDYTVKCDSPDLGMLVSTAELNLNNSKSIDNDNMTVTWDVPYYYNCGATNKVTIVENCDVDGYIYEPKPSSGTANNNIVEFNVAAMASNITRTIRNIYTEDEKERFGSYQVRHEYYAKDKEGNLILENTVSENIVSNIVVDTVIEADKINQSPENNGKNYIFLEHTGNITIEENVTKEITIKYVRDKEYGSYVVKHEYYTKDKNGNMTLDKTDIEEAVFLETGTILDTSTIELKPEQYTYSEISDKTVTIETNVEKIITIKYVKEEKYGFYQVKHEYYVKDKENNLTLENTVSENIVSNVIVGTIIEADKINQIPENNDKNYTFLEHTGNITIEENITKEITIKYVRNKEYGSYVVKHEYYTKDKDSNMILDKTDTEEAVFLETGTILDTSTIELKPEQYTYSEISDKTVTIETDVEKIITIKYVKEEKYGFYQVKHEYYVKDKENNLTLENTVSENIVSNVIVGTIIEADKINQIPENNDKNYTFYEHTGNITIEENITKEITIKYVRNKEYGSYKVKHNYYVKDKNGNFILEETVLEDSVLAEPNVSIGLKDADIIISQKLRDGYTFKDSSENMTIQANKEIEFVINYFREESVIIEYGSYQVIHQYYLDDKLETTITENTVSNIKVGTSIGVADADILVFKKLNHNNKNYEFISANKVVIESNKTATLIIKYVRKTEPIIPEEVKPVSVSITAKKKLENGSLKDKQFSFRLTNGLVTYIAENDSHGNINFNPLTFDTEGTYKFTLSEDNTNESNIQYDSSIYDLEIVVSKVDNSLTASVKYFKDGKEFNLAEFINKYELPKEEKPNETPPVDNNKPNNKPSTSTSDLIELPDNEVSQSAPITGDSSNVLVFMLLFIISGLSLIFLKKRNNF